MSVENYWKVPHPRLEIPPPEREGRVQRCAIMGLEAGVGIEPAYTALQTAAVQRQIKHFGQFHFRQTGVNRSKNRLFFKDRGWRGESDFGLPTATAFCADAPDPNWRSPTYEVSCCRMDPAGHDHQQKDAAAAQMAQNPSWESTAGRRSNKWTVRVRGPRREPVGEHTARRPAADDDEVVLICHRLEREIGFAEGNRN
jgi:hypothetical protein